MNKPYIMNSPLQRQSAYCHSKPEAIASSCVVGTSLVQRRLAAQGGVSLVELMVAMTLGLVLTGAIIQLMITNTSNYQLQSAMVEVQQSAVYSVRYFTEEIRKSGYSSDMLKLNPPIFQGGNSRVAARLDGGLSAALGNLDSRWQAGMGFFETTSQQVPPFILADGYASDGATAQDSDTLTIQYLAQQNESTCAGDPITNNVIVATTFFVENGELRCTAYRPDGDAGGGLTTNTDVLMENVDNFQVLYGLDFERGDRNTPGYESGIGEPEVFLNAQNTRAALTNPAIYAAGNKPNVVAIRIGLLLSSNLNTDLNSAGQVYNVLDNTVTDEDLNSDGNFRRLFTTTVQLLNVPRSI